ncbi:hypothetical protein FG064_16300 [Vibrio cholerae]|nr:hypothetical protein [Vibrio cholerae]
MDFNRFLSTYSSLKHENRFSMIANVGLVAMLGVSLFVNFQKDTVVINNLNENCQSMELSSSWMNESTHRRLGVFLATQLGNITPENAKHIEKTVLPYASPMVYQKVDDLIALQLSELVREKVTMQFTPEKTFVENGTTFVTGKGRMTGVTGKSTPYIRTYEFVFDVENYTPTFDYLNVYDDVPRDAKWKAKNSSKEARQNK